MSGIVKAADERNASHADMFNELQLLFEEQCKVDTIASSPGASQDGLRAAKLESALVMKELELQTLPGRASENSTLRAGASRRRVLSRRLVARKEKL